MLFGYIDVEGLGASVHPQKALVFRNLTEAREELEDQAREHFKGSHSPLLLRVFIGTPDGDEETYGYPDEPDYVFRADGNHFNDDIQIVEAA